MEPESWGWVQPWVHFLTLIRPERGGMGMNRAERNRKKAREIASRTSVSLSIFPERKFSFPFLSSCFFPLPSPNLTQSPGRAEQPSSASCPPAPILCQPPSDGRKSRADLSHSLACHHSPCGPGPVVSPPWALGSAPVSNLLLRALWRGASEPTQCPCMSWHRLTPSLGTPRTSRAPCPTWGSVLRRPPS